MNFFSVIKRFLSEKNKILVRNISLAFIIKLSGVLLSFFATPLFIKYFNNDSVLGIWYTLLSVLNWVMCFDLGIGNGIRNQLVKDLTMRDYSSARQTISSGLFIILLITLAILPVGYIFFRIINLNSFFNIDVTLISNRVLFDSTILVFIAILLRFFLSSISAIIYALQKSAINDFTALAASLLQFLFVLFVKFDNAEAALVGLAKAYIFIINLPVIIVTFVVFLKDLRMCLPSIKAINKKRVKSVINIGIIFFLCQILIMILMYSNEIMISNLYGPDKTTQYNFYYKITSVISMVFSLMLAPIWSLVTKSIVEKDFQWVYKLYRILKLFALGAAMLQFGLIPFEQWIMNLWLGEGYLIIDLSYSIAFACLGSVFIYTSILSTIICGLGTMKLQAIVYFLVVIIKFLVMYLFKNCFGWIMIVWLTAIALGVYCLAQTIKLDIDFKSNKYVNDNIK